MTISELMRELGSGYVFRSYCRGVGRGYQTEIYTTAEQDVDGFAVIVASASADSYEEAAERLVVKMFDEFGATCSVCSNRHIATAMLETDEPEPKPLCDDCAQVANDMRPEEAE